MMSRANDRIKKKLEKNPIVECNKVQNKYVPNLMEMFAAVKDSRNQSYIKYDVKTMIAQIYFKGIAGIESMQEMTRVFNDENAVANIYSFIESKAQEMLPHGVTENEFLENLNPEELEKIQAEIVRTLIRRKTFNDARFLQQWIVIIDATELDESFVQKNEYYITRTYNRGTDNEFVKSHRSVLEAKIYFGDNLVCSIASEPIENSDEYLNQSDDVIKQDCEQKAFYRLAAKIKKLYPRLPIIILADGLYVSEPVMKTILDYGWNYIIRYKEGSAKSIAAEFRALPEIEKVGSRIKYQNQIMYHDLDVNLIYFTEKKKEKTTEFAWITSIEITKKNAEKLAFTGRLRWKIENQGFNRQKHWQGNLEHACSWDKTAQRNHYLIEQIADFIKQLYEYFYLEKKGIKKKQKNISSELLASFGRQLITTEDTNKILNESALS